MTTEQLIEYRAWAAGVCGYSLEGHHGRALYGEYVRESADGFEYVEKESWRPDENIAQAFEVLDALRLEPQMILLNRPPSNRWWVTVSRYFQNGPEGMAQHESRCLAILTAARAAWDAMQKEGT